MSSNKLSRRKLVNAGVKTAVAAPLVVRNLEVQATENRHDQQERYFIFVELKGGVQWSIGPASADPAWLANQQLNDSFKVIPVDPDGEYGLTEALYESELNLPKQAGCQSRLCRMNEGMILPVLSPEARKPDNLRRAINESFQSLRTDAGSVFHMGFGAKALWDPQKRYYNDLAMIKGVNVQGGFHGPANYEVYSGTHQQGEAWHVAAVIAQILEQRHGVKLLDNIYLENPTINRSSDDQYALEPKAISAFFLDFLAGNEMNRDTLQAFNLSRVLTEMYLNYPLTDEHKSVLASYRDAMPKSREVAAILQELKAKKFFGRDLSLDLKTQMELAIEMITRGLTRVATLAHGSRTATNGVDEFGLFDSHVSLYTNLRQYHSYAHHVSLNHAMEAVTLFLEWARNNRHPKSGALWKDHVTLVMSSEFGRTLNLAGSTQLSASTSDGNILSLGSGHNRPGNIYMFAGAMGGGIEAGRSYGELTNETSEGSKAISPKSVVRTILAMVGEDGRYNDYYPLDAKLGIKRVDELFRR